MNIEVTHTLRLYDPEFIARLGALLERVRDRYRNKNEFMTEIMTMGYERYIALEQAAQVNGTENAVSDTAAVTPEIPLSLMPEGYAEIAQDVKELRNLMSELSLYLTTQMRHIHINLSLTRRLLSAIYNMNLGFVGGKAVPAEKVEDGFFDDLPERFEEIVTKLEQQYGLAT